MKRCLDLHVVPSDIKQRVLRGKPKKPDGIERAFLRDEIEKASEYVDFAKREYRKVLKSVRNELSFVDGIRFCKACEHDRS